jgi:hypothetical protein
MKEALLLYHDISSQSVRYKKINTFFGGKEK